MDVNPGLYVTRIWEQRRVKLWKQNEMEPTCLTVRGKAQTTSTANETKAKRFSAGLQKLRVTAFSKKLLLFQHRGPAMAFHPLSGTNSWHFAKRCRSEGNTAHTEGPQTPGVIGLLCRPRLVWPHQGVLHVRGRLNLFLLSFHICSGNNENYKWVDKKSCLDLLRKMRRGGKKKKRGNPHKRIIKISSALWFCSLLSGGKK